MKTQGRAFSGKQIKLPQDVVETVSLDEERSNKGIAALTLLLLLAIPCMGM